MAAIEYPAKPWTDGQEFTVTDVGTFRYVSGKGWRTVSGDSTIDSELESIRDSLSDKVSREDLDAINENLSFENRVQVLGAVSGVTPIDLSKGTYVKVVSTSAAWQPEFTNWPGGGVEVILSVDSSGAHAMTDPAGVEWDDDTTAPVSGDWVDGSRNVLRFTRLPLDEGLIGEFIRDTTVPDPDPTVTPPTLTGWYSTSADRSSPTALDGATLPAGDVYVWFGPDSSDIASIEVFFNESGTPATDGSQATLETYVRTAGSFPFDLMPGSTPSVPVVWSTDEGDPTGNDLTSYDGDGENTIKVRANLIDGQTVIEAFTFDTTAPAAVGSTPTRTSSVKLYSSGSAAHSVTIPAGVDRAVVVHAQFRNSADAKVTGLTLGGTAMTVDASEWYYTTQYFGQIVCTLTEASLSTGTFDIVPTWDGAGPSAASLIGYHVEVFTNVASPVFDHAIDYENAVTDRNPALTSVPANSFLMTTSSEEGGGADMTVSGITPDTLYAQQELSASWLDQAFRAAVVDDSGASGNFTATWDTASKGLAALSSLSYSASAGGGGGVTPIIPAKVGTVTLSNAVDNQLAASWPAATDAVSYQIKWGLSSPPARTPVPNADLDYTITGLASATTQYVQVRGVSSTGHVGDEWSDVVSATVTGDVNPPGEVQSKFETSTDPYDVTMSEGMGAMRYGDLYLPTPWRRVNANGSTENQLAGIVAASAIANDVFIGRWNSARKTPFQAQVGPRLFVTLHMAVDQHGVFNRGTLAEKAAGVLDIARSGSTGSNNRDWVWRKIAADTNSTVTVAGKQWNLADHVFLSISHESSGGWSPQYWGFVPDLVGHPALNNPSTALYGSEMAAAIQYVHDTGLLTKVHRVAYEHISDVFDDENPNIIRGMSPAMSNSSEPYDSGRTGSALSATWYSDAIPTRGVDFVIPTNYWRKFGLTYTGSGSTTDPANYTDDANFGSFAIAIAEQLGAAYGQLEYGAEYGLINNGKDPGDTGAPTDLELEMAFRRTYDTVFPAVSTGLCMFNHWMFYSWASFTRANSGNTFHPLEGVWGQIANGQYFTGTSRPTSGMVNQSLVPASNTRYPRTLDWFRDEFDPSRLD